MILRVYTVYVFHIQHVYYLIIPKVKVKITPILYSICFCLNRDLFINKVLMNFLSLHCFVSPLCFDMPLSSSLVIHSQRAKSRGKNNFVLQGDNRLISKYTIVLLCQIYMTSVWRGGGVYVEKVFFKNYSSTKAK